MENRGGRDDGDGGSSLQVLGMVNGHKTQLLRFDMFRICPTTTTSRTVGTSVTTLIH